ncbi:unnamed protein product, partial [Meganyctiphanes norvegica]
TTDEEMADGINDDESLSEETEDDLSEQDQIPNKDSHMNNSDQPTAVKATIHLPVLSFDEYGNLTTIIQPPAEKIGDFDDEPINTKENIQTKLKGNRKHSQKKKISSTNLLNEVVNGDASPRSSRSKAKIEQSPESAAAQQEMQQAFKEFQAAPTSRYGRTRKRKADDDFYHGTINFNELRKIASNSSGKNQDNKEKNEVEKEDKQERFEIKNQNKQEELAVEKIQDDPVDNLERNVKNTRNNRKQPLVEEESEKEESKIETESKILSQESDRILDTKNVEDKSTRNRIESNSDIERRSKKRKKSLKALRHSSPSIDNELENIFEKFVNKVGNNVKSDVLSKSNKFSKDSNENKSRSQLALPEKASSKLEAETSHMLDFVGAAQALRRRNIPIQIQKVLQDSDHIVKHKSERTIAEIALFLPPCYNYQSDNKESNNDAADSPAELQLRMVLRKNEQELSSEPQEQSTSKFGRQVKKPQLIDLVEMQKKQKEALEKKKEELASHVVKHEGMLSKEELRVLEKMHPCTHLVGDLVWVNMRGSPLWPAMLAYSQAEGTYTRISLKQNWSKVHGHREYHVQFFNDNNRTYWIHPLNVLPFEGYEKLLDYLNLLRHELRSMIKNKKQHAESLLKTLNHAKKVESGVKQERWMQAIRDAQAALPCDRYERIRRYTTGFESDPCIQVERPINNVLSRTSAAQKLHRRSAPAAMPIKKKRGRPFKLPRLENKLISATISKGYSSQSTDGDFSGFESADDKKRLQKRFVDNNNDRDFEVYLEKHLSLYRKEKPKVSQKDAESNLYLQWSKLSKQQRVAYRSRLKVEEVKRKYRSVSPTLDDHDTPGKAKKKKMEEDDEEDLKGTYKVVRNEKVCFICEGVSECPQNKGTDMLKCKGLCCGVFHLNCVGLRGAPAKDFKCQDCSQRRHICFVCKSSEGTTQRCCVAACGKFYHVECTEAWPLVCRQRNTERLVCPRHFCHMCAAIADDVNDASARTPSFTRCLRCPTTYHTGEDCIAAGVEEVSSNHHICTKHIAVSKSGSHVNVSWCFCCSKGGNLVLCDQCPAAFHADCMKIELPNESKGYVCEDCDNGKFPVYGDIVWVKLGAYRWWPGQVLHPRYIPDNIENLPHKQGMFCVHFFGSNDYYWVSRGRTFLYQEGDKGSKNATSKTLEKQFGLALKQAAEAFSELCTQKEKKETTRTQKGILVLPSNVTSNDLSGQISIFRLTYNGRLNILRAHMCVCVPRDNSCLKGGNVSILDMMLMFECLREVCPAGDKCCNQRFQRRQYPKIQSFKTSGRGWGLQGLQDIKKGASWNTNVLDIDNFKKRFDNINMPKKDNFFQLTLNKVVMVQMAPKGEYPKTVLESYQHVYDTPRNVLGLWSETSDVIIINARMSPAILLSFTYNSYHRSDRAHYTPENTHIGGKIAIKLHKSNENTVKRQKLQKKRKKRKRKEVKATEDECFRCGGTGDLILCDVTQCPKGYHLNCLGLQTTPKGKWICPWHHCDECGGKALARCTLCPNSFCRKHNRLEQHPEFGAICSDHNDDESELSDSNQPSE